MQELTVTSTPAIDSIHQQHEFGFYYSKNYGQNQVANYLFV